VIGIREKGCYHAVVQYYSPYLVRPLVPPDIVGACVRSTLAKMGIPIFPPPLEEKPADKDKEPVRDK